jgi:hypothetical protein
MALLKSSHFVQVAIGSAARIGLMADISRREHPLCQLDLMLKEPHMMMATFNFSISPKGLNSKYKQ